MAAKGEAAPSVASQSMRTVILLLVLSVAQARAGLSRLEALGMIETGNNDAAVGEAGEVSRYQIKPWIWRQYSQSEVYQNHHLSSEVAEKYLAALEQLFRDRTGREPDDFDLYVLWNAGPTYYARVGFKQSRVHPIIRDRARRYVNLRQLKEAEAESVKVAPPTAVASPPLVASPADTLPRPALAAPSPQSNAETLWPLFSAPPPAGLQSPLFSTLPLVAHPDAAPLTPQPIFAVGGLKPQ